MGERTIGVVGAGTMGAGIVQLLAQHGYDVVVHDVSAERLSEALETVESALREAERGGYVEDAAAAFARVTGETDLAALADAASFVVEATPERLDLKKEVFAELDAHASADAVLATNTSSLSVTDVASATDRPERVVGMHFFNPPVKMRLVELVVGHHTTEETTERARALAESLDREAIRVEDVPGFATSRLGVALGVEAARMVQEGVATPEDVDRAMCLGYNHPMGPLELGDHVGWDVRVEIANYLTEELGERFRPPQNLKRMVRAGDLGVKTGRGFYDWTEDR